MSKVNAAFEFFRTEVYRFFRETSAHGFSYIGNHNHPAVKTFWGLVVIFGFTMSAMLYLENEIQWIENPFVTTIEKRSILEHPVQFPTVTVCPHPMSPVDRWSLVRRLTNAAKFECYPNDRGYDWGYPSCEDTEEARRVDFVEEITDRLFDSFTEMLLGQELDNVTLAPDDKKYIVPLIRLSREEVMAKAKDSLGKFWDFRHMYEDDAPQCEGADCDEIMCEGIANATDCAEKRAEAEETFKALSTLISGDFIPLGLLVSTFSGLLGGWSLSNKAVYTSGCAMGDLENQVHDYLRELSDKLGLGGDVSLFDVPLMLGLQRFPEASKVWFIQTPYPRFVSSSCAKMGEGHPVVGFINAWKALVNKGGQHPCDVPELYGNRSCNLWAEFATGDNVAAVLKVMKASLRLGWWDAGDVSSAMEGNGRFPTWNYTAGFTEYPSYQTFVPVSYFYDEPAADTGTHLTPVVTDQGICLAANSKPVEEVFRPGLAYAEAFKEAFVKELSGKSDNHGFVRDAVGFDNDRYDLKFYIDPGHFPLLERSTYEEYYSVALNHAGDTANVRRRRVKLRPGEHTTVRVTGITRVAVTDDVKSTDPEVRKCLLAHESGDRLSIFSEYTQSSCWFECRLRMGAELCRCIPWNYPREKDNMTPTCDLYGAFCFDAVMANLTAIRECDCPQECEYTRFDYVEYRTPADSMLECRSAAKGPTLVQHAGARRREVRPNFVEKYDEAEAGNVTFGKAPESNAAAREKFCARMLETDTSVVVVELGTDSFIEVIQSRKVSFGDRIGTFGGTLGLFTGMSILSMVEVGYWMIKTAVKATRKRKQ